MLRTSVREINVKHPNFSSRAIGSEVAEWLANWLLVLEVPGSIRAGGEENLLVRTRTLPFVSFAGMT